MIKNIVFDFGNVIGRFDYKEAISKITDDKDATEFLIDNVINSPFWTGLSIMDTGLVTYDEVIMLINDRNNNKYADLVEKLVNNYYNSISISDEMVNIVKSIKEKGYNIYLLSNTTREVVHIFKDHKIFTYFSGFVLSYKINKVKPYDGIYNYLFDKYNLNPEECLFIDDKDVNIQNLDSSDSFNYIEFCNLFEQKSKNYLLKQKKQYLNKNKMQIDWKVNALTNIVLQLDKNHLLIDDALKNRDRSEKGFLTFDEFELFLNSINAKLENDKKKLI